MLSRSSLSLLALLPLLVACQSQYRSDPVLCETYVHRYGMPMDPDEWSDRGRDGQIISVQRDGVTVTKSMSGGVLDGETTYSFPYREGIQRREVYGENRLQRTTHYYPDGNPRLEIAPQPSGAVSHSAWYERSGVPAFQETYSPSKELVQGVYHNPAGDVEAEVIDGEGRRMQWDSFGCLTHTDEIGDGRLISRTTYHVNGNPAVKSFYAGDKIENKRLTFTPQGEPATVESRKGNVQHGNTEEFVHGEKIADVPYVDGYRQGVERRYRNDGRDLIQEITWVKGHRTGPCRYYVNGNVETDWYFNDQPVNRSTYEVMTNQRGR